MSKRHPLFSKGIWSGGRTDTQSGLFELGSRARNGIAAENHGTGFFRSGVVSNRARAAQKRAAEKNSGKPPAKNKGWFS